MKIYNYILLLFLKSISFTFLAVSGTYANEVKNSATVFMYHKFGVSKYPSTSVTIDQLSSHIEELTKAEAPSKISCFTMCLNRTWYRLEAKNKILSNDSTKGLDAAILQDHIFEPILKIDDPRISNRIDFVGGIRGLGELERRCELDAKVAFALYPVTIEQLLKVSDEGKVMPPKSTWFEPKLRSGLVVRSLD